MGHRRLQSTDSLGVMRTPVGERAQQFFTPGPPDNCWPWQGYITPGGYGSIYSGGHNGVRITAHRVVYEIYHGPIPAGAHIDHLCHNRSVCIGGPTCPHRRCVNPGHLGLTTPAVNSSRGAVARRAARPQCPRGHDPAEFHTRRGHRECRACTRERAAAVRTEVKAGRATPQRVCVDCGRMTTHCARGRCRRCYTRWYRTNPPSVVRQARPGLAAGRDQTKQPPNR